MDTKDALALGLGIAPPWKLVGQRLDTDKRPNELHIELAADRGAMFPCPDCGKACKAHDFGEFTWRHLNFFQHHCYITAKVPRTDCPDHGVKRIQVPWARRGQPVYAPVRASGGDPGARDAVCWPPPASSASPISVCGASSSTMSARPVARLDLGRLKAVGLDETASKRGHNYVTVFIDLDAKQKPVVFVTPGKGKANGRRVQGVPGATWRQAGPHRRGGLRHVSGLPGGHRRDLRAGQRDGRLVPCRPAVHQGGRLRCARPKPSTTPCPRRYAGPCSRPPTAN